MQSAFWTSRLVLSRAEVLVMPLILPQTVHPPQHHPGQHHLAKSEHDYARKVLLRHIQHQRHVAVER